MTSVAVPPAAAWVFPQPEGEIWAPSNTPLGDGTPSVKGTNVAPPINNATAQASDWIPQVAVPVTPGTATVQLGINGTEAKAARAATGGASSASAGSALAQAGTLPVAVAPAPERGEAAQAVTVEVTDPAKGQAAGASGPLVALSDADSSAGGIGRQAKVTLDLKNLQAAGWADRARLVALPACSLTTPQLPECRIKTPVASTVDTTGHITADITLPNGGTEQASSPATQSSTVTTAVKASYTTTGTPLLTQASAGSTSAPMVLSAEPSPSGAGGSYAATSLAPSTAWSSGSNAGNFNYSYPIQVPAALGGSSPAISLGYNSAAVDGKTSATNSQSSWIGDGWNYEPGFIERSYKNCDKAGITGSADLCWGGQNASLSLAGHSGTLVRDDALGVWHLQDDDGTKVEKLTGAPRAVGDQDYRDMEYWRITTPDGTEYYFGRNHLPGGDGTDKAANSVLTAPVYSPTGGATPDPCYNSSTGSSSWCQMAWRWQLDYVVDTHGDLTTYKYATEGNKYSRGGAQSHGNGTTTDYQRAGYLTEIGYGQRLDEQKTAKGTLNPAAKVLFTTAERCKAAGAITCDESQRTTANADAWPDVPIDQICTTTCTTSAPTFFTTKRLSSITTQVLVNSAFTTVDSWALSQSLEDPGDGTKRTLQLNSVTRTGSNGQTPITLPAVTFGYSMMANRVDGLVPAAPMFNRPRIREIGTETGGRINVVYSAPECSRVASHMPSSEDGNTMACMPVKWYLPGQSSPDPVNDWFNKIIVQSVTQQDAVAGSVSTVVDYEYGGGAAWHRNDSELADPKMRTWDQFRGYATVTTRSGSGSAVEAPRTQSVSTFLRGMDGDVLANGSKRSVSVADVQGGSIVDQDVLAGYIRDTRTYDQDAGTVVADMVSTPWLGAITATRAQSGGMPPITARATASGKVTSRSRLANGTWRTTEQASTYDSTVLARPLTVEDKGDLAHPEQLLCTSFTYATGPNSALTQLASRTLVLSGACAQTPTAANTVADTRSYYDGLPLGQAGAKSEQTATEVLEKYNGATPQYRYTAKAAFDAYGRVLSTIDPSRTDATHPLGAETKTGYSPATGSLPTVITHTNPLGWQNTTTLDVGRALPVKAQDENGRISEQDYDALGRGVAAWQPGYDRSKGALPNRTFSYALNGTNAPSTVLTQALMGDLKTYTSSFTIYDGLGRIRQTQASTPSGAPGRMITDALFDSHSWQTKTSAAYYNDQALPSGALFLPNGGVAPDGQIPAQTVLKYDGQGRTTDSVFQSFGIEQWRSTSQYVGVDETRSIPPAGGFATATITDGRGQTAALRQYKANTPTGAYDETTYGYTASGKEAWRKDAAGNRWTYEYDLLGRPVKTTDPDSGTGTMAYDDTKNLVTASDSRGKSATSVTDLLGRPTASYEGTAVDPAKQVSGSVYDSLVLGKPTSTTRYAVGPTGTRDAYKSEITGYDVGYRALGTKATIPASEGKLAGTYLTSNTYDKAGRPATTQLPAVAGMGVETLTFAFDTVGQLAALSGASGWTSTPYLTDVRYDPYGRPIRTTVGASGVQVVSTMVIDNATGRVTRSTLDKQSAVTASVDVNDYTYNAMGQVTSVRDAQDGAVADLQCFTHDYLGRLTQAWTDTGTQTTADQPSVPNVGNCTNAGMPHVGGPAPYWQQYEYDLIGNRTKLVQKDVTGDTSKDVTTTQTFATGPNTPTSDPTKGGGTGGPHALVKSTQTGPAGTAVTSYTYDAAGNTAAITSTPGTKTLTWNPQGKLDQITGTGQSAGTSYLYDSAGNQLIRRDPGKTTLNLGTDQLTLDTSTPTGAVTGVRSYGAPGGLSVTRTITNGTSTLAYQASDPHGTNGVQFDAGTLAQVRRPTDPFGNERGTQPGTGVWAGNKGFVGGTKETATGFTLLGAREYDPKTGRFISPDPIMDAGDPQQWNAYAYANNSPVNKSDANGLRVACDTPAECQSLREYEAEQKGSKPPTPTPTPPPSADEQEAQTDYDNAQKTVTEGKRKRDEIKHQVVDLIGDLIGFNDARDCFTKGDVMACVNTALNAVPWGKLFKAIKVGIKAFKVYKEIDKAYDVIRAGERAAADAEKAIVRAKRASDEARAAEKAAAKAAEEKAAKETAGDAAGTEAKASKAEADTPDGPTSCNSFPAETRVLMADGTTKAIGEVHDGDVVMATDPQTGETRPETVTTTITTPDDKAFTDLTLTDDANPRGPPATLTSTHHHPYWSDTRHQWVDAGELTPGEHLRRPDGTTLTVQNVRNYAYAVTTHNLTVDQLHTYYVLVGATPVLVHNCNVTVYRAQRAGGHSERIHIDAGGNVTASGDAMIHVNMSGKIEHTEAFRGSESQIVAFDVPKSFLDEVRAAAIGQRRPKGMSRREWNIDSVGRPQIDDPKVAADLYGIPHDLFGGENFSALLSAVIPGSGRVIR